MLPKLYSHPLEKINFSISKPPQPHIVCLLWPCSVCCCMYFCLPLYKCIITCVQLNYFLCLFSSNMIVVTKKQKTRLQERIRMINVGFVCHKIFNSCIVRQSRHMVLYIAGRDAPSISQYHLNFRTDVMHNVTVLNVNQLRLYFKFFFLNKPL